MNTMTRSRSLVCRGRRVSFTAALLAAYSILNAGAACAQRTTASDSAAKKPQLAGVQTVSGGEVAGSEPLSPVSSRFAEIARRVTPAVVSISTEFSSEATARLDGRQRQLPPGIPPEFLPPGLRHPQRQATATGSGFIVSKDGYILTNNHMVDGAEKVTVTLLDHRIFTARVIGHDPNTDVALIKIEGSDLPTVQLGNDSTVQVGDQVVAIGNPLGLDFTVTSGIISAKGRADALRNLFRTDFAVVDFLQTDAVINPGNSGGPLLDMQARVIGINTAIASPTGVYAGYGFAIPISIARTVMNDLQQYGEVRRGVLGVSIQDVGPADAQAAGLDEIRGAMVGGFVSDSSPARKAGLEPGDIILAVDGEAVTRVSQLQGMLLGYKPGESVKLDVMRFGKEHQIDVTLGAAPEAREVAERGEGGGSESSPTSKLGIAVSPVTPAVSAQLELPSGTEGLAVADVDPDGLAASKLFPRDVIMASLGGGGGRRQNIRSAGDLEKAIDTAKGGVLSLLVYTPQLGGTRVVNIDIE